MINKEVRKELVIIPAQVKVINHVTYVYGCRNCEQNGIESTIIKAKSPKALIPKSMVSTSLMSYVLYQKYTNAMPLYRQEQDFNRLGVRLTRQNISNWVIKAASLLTPLAIKLKEHLIASKYLHADETTLEVLCEPNRPAEIKSYMWVYLTNENSEKQIVLYDYTMGRGGVFPKTYLEGFKGSLQTDGYVGYRKLEPEVKLHGCFAHLRRKIVDAMKINNYTNKCTREEVMFNLCEEIFAIENKAKEENLSVEELQKVRQEKSKPVVEALYRWIDTEGEKVLPKSLLGKAVTYAKTQRVYLTRFLEDGNISLTNNYAERNIKPFVIGRKNWLFCNTPNGAKSSAIIYSVIQTAIQNNLNPLTYLNFIFEYIKANGQVTDQLLPWSDNVKELCRNPKKD